MLDFDNRIAESLYFGRPDNNVPTMVTAVPPGGEITSDYTVGSRLLVVRHPIRVTGYQFAGYKMTTTASPVGDPPPPIAIGSYWRFALLRGHGRLGLPTGAMLRNSDTGARIIYSIGAPSRDAVRKSPLATNEVEYVTLMLANPVLIETPGLYWIAIARLSSLDTGEEYFGSYVPAHIKGLRDLMSNQVVSNISTLDFAALVTLNETNEMADQKFDFAGKVPEITSLSNLDVALITERWPNV